MSQTLLSGKQITWLEILYKAKVKSRAASPMPQAMFSTLKEFGYVSGSAASATLTPTGAGALIQRLQKAEQSAKEAKKGPKCSTKSKKNSDQATSSSPQFAELA